MLILFGNVLFYIILTWYFDHTIASNRGRAEPFYFPFNRIAKYFKINQPSAVPIDSTFEYDGFSLQEEEESAIKERNKVYNNSKNRAPAFGLRIKDLSKTFKSLFSQRKVQALKRFNL